MFKGIDHAISCPCGYRGMAWNTRVLQPQPDGDGDAPNCRTIGCGPRNPGVTTATSGGRGGGGDGGGRGPTRIKKKVPSPPERLKKGGKDSGVADAAASAAMRVLSNALTPLTRQPSGPTLSPEIQRLVADMGTVVASVVSGQMVRQGNLPLVNADEDPEGDGRRASGPTTQDDGGRCKANWQSYGERQRFTDSSDSIEYRATLGMACVVSVNKEDRTSLTFELPGLDTSKRMSRCHLIGHKLNGSSVMLENFVPCYQDTTNNSWMWHQVESRIAERVATDPVFMVSIPVYPDKNTGVPSSIVVAAISNKDWTCIVNIPNTPKAEVLSSGYVFKGC